METKKEWKFFSIVEHKQEEAYLRQQHNVGWKFVKVTGIGTYHFVKCEPEDMVYQLDYNQDSSSGKAEYIKMFADCGWDYIQEFMGYCYFRKPVAEMNGKEEIFSDDSSRLAMLERVFKHRVLPLLILLFSVLLPQFIRNLNHRNYDVAVFMGCMILLYIVILVFFAIQYYRQKKK